MEAFMFYLGKMILCSGVMFAYYLLFLKDKTFHHYNRFYLLLTVIISLVLPLIKVSYFTIETNQNFYLLLSQLNQNQLQNSTNDLTIYQILYAISGVVSIILLVILILGITKIQSIKNKFPNETIEGIKFYQTNLNNAPFSFFRNLFWKQSIQLDSPVGQQILKHEMVHIQQKHSWDKLLMQTVKSLFWFNPVFYFINKEINLIHEYLADNKAVNKSDTRAFAQMLLESHFSGSVLPVTSPFLSSNLKKRLKMLTKNQTKYSYARKLFALPILFFMVFAYMVNAKNKEITETNQAIEIAVNELKNDTIKPKTSELDSLSTEHQRQARVYSDALQEDHLKMSAISKKLADKGKELSALKKAKKEETPEYKALEKDMETLASQMENIVSSDNYKNNIKGLEGNAEAVAKIYDSPAFKNKIALAEKSAKEAEKRVNSPEFKKRIADAEKRALEAEKRVNSPELKKRIADAEKRAEEAVARVNSPESEFRIRIANAEKLAQTSVDNIGKIYSEADFHKMITDQFGKDAFTDGTVAYGINASKSLQFKDLPKFEYNFDSDVFYNTEAVKLTPREIKKLEKKRKELRKKQLELQEEQKKLQLKQRELNKEAGQNSPWIISVDAKARPAVNNISYVGVATYTEDSPKTNYYLNGQKISSADFKNISSKDIRTVDVLKENKVSTIKIVTK
ncbi:M56 family metallopeptidase [Chryseobacterium sp. FH1]|uniref:M56 family metallopeptidase n=1 Tax=Chryseobacterium sp. FH1 TaxID=1233951 RepID=UPI00068D2954|nr:M56 family metallopeptidase [Chryseobacterium sp. FH1]